MLVLLHTALLATTYDTAPSHDTASTNHLTSASDCDVATDRVSINTTIEAAREPSTDSPDFVIGIGVGVGVGGVAVLLATVLLILGGRYWHMRVQKCRTTNISSSLDVQVIHGDI